MMLKIQSLMLKLRSLVLKLRPLVLKLRSLGSHGRCEAILKAKLTVENDVGATVSDVELQSHGSHGWMMLELQSLMLNYSLMAHTAEWCWSYSLWCWTTVSWLTRLNDVGATVSDVELQSHGSHGWMMLELQSLMLNYSLMAHTAAVELFRKKSSH